MKLKDKQAVEIKTEVANNSLIINVNKLYCNFRSKDFKYSLAILTARGYLDVQFGNASLMVKASIVDQEVDGRKIPALKIQDAKLDLDLEQMIIDVKGNSIADLAKYVAILFQNRIAQVAEE